MIDFESPDTSNQTSEPGSEDAPPRSVEESALVADGSLTPEGKRAVAGWINEGLGLSEVQKKTIHRAWLHPYLYGDAFSSG